MAMRLPWPRAARTALWLERWTGVTTKTSLGQAFMSILCAVAYTEIVLECVKCYSVVRRHTDAAFFNHEI